MIRALPQRRPPKAGAVDVVIVGAGHSGLAMSRCLAEHGIDHVVLERGDIANSWRHERWDSLKLLTANWQCRLPGYRYRGPAPDGFMSKLEVVQFIDAYAEFIAAPVRTGTRVGSVVADGGGYRVETNARPWQCRAVVLANGAHAIPVVPACAGALPESIASVTPNRYRSAATLDDRPVLVVGASATGLQIADEIRRSGRRVFLAVGEHVRMPREYRGRDIQWWMHTAGLLDERYDEVEDLERARRVPSPQLVGSKERVTLDLNALQQRGVEIVGRFAGISGERAWFSGSLRNHCALADLKLGRLLDRLDAWAAGHDLDRRIPPPERFAPTRVPASPRLVLDLTRERIGTVIWATGFRPDYSWLRVPALDRKGRLQHDGGVVGPGLYAMGLPFMRRRKSSFIHGAEDDARDLSARLENHLRGCRRALPACAGC